MVVAGPLGARYAIAAIIGPSSIYPSVVSPAVLSQTRKRLVVTIER